LHSPASPTSSNGAIYGLALVCMLAPLIVFVPAFMTGEIVPKDFASFYSGALAASEGSFAATQAYDYEALTARHQTWFGRELLGMPWGYSPVAFLLVVPLAFLSAAAAFGAWTFINVIATVTAMRAMGMPLTVGIAGVLFPTSVMSIVAGQNGGLSAGLFGLAISLLHRSEWAAGLCFGLLCYKPQLGILIPVALVAGGHWRAFAGATLTVVTLVLCSLAAWGIGPWLAFIDTAIPEYWGHLTRGELPFPKMVTVYPFLRQLAVPHHIAYALQVVAATMAAGAVWWAWRKSDLVVRTSVLTAGMFLATPYAYYYDLTVFLVPIAALLARRGLAWPTLREANLAALLWLLPLGNWTLAHWVDVQVWPILLTCALGAIFWRAGTTPVRRVPFHASRSAGDRVP
jgi:hypothetical protein